MVVERRARMQNDDRRDQEATRQMPEEDLLGQGLVLPEQGRKIEKTEKTDWIAISVRAEPAENRNDEQERVEGVLRRERGAPVLEWVTAPDNERAQKVYARQGAEAETWLEYELVL